jgi:hypothetical protein
MEKKHVDESIQLKKEEMAKSAKLRAELLNEVANNKEEEAEKKAMKAYEEGKRRE